MALAYPYNYSMGSGTKKTQEKNIKVIKSRGVGSSE